ncbi:MAG: NAD-glutamate dehydrogenase, partial [Glaciecola sp.]
LKDKFNIPQITNNPYYNKLLVNAFPPVLREKYQAQMQEHPLRSEIIATKLTNEMVNDMGLNFVYRLQEETGALVEQVAEAYSVVKGVLDVSSLWESVEGLDNKIDAQLQLKILNNIRRILRRTCRWYIRHGGKTNNIEKAINRYKPAFIAVSENLGNYLVSSEFEEVQAETKRLIEAKVPKDVAYRVAGFSNMFSSMDLAQIAELEKRSVDVVARLYYQLGSRFELHWFLEQINQQSVSNHWQALARASYREELDWQQRSLTSVLLNIEPDENDADKILNDWCEANKDILKRWYHMMAEFKTSDNHEFAKFSVALRELMLLSVKANH